jgi:hypothetical protein
MNKAGRTRDELFKNLGGTGIAPRNSFPGSASDPRKLSGDAVPIKQIRPDEPYPRGLLPDISGSGSFAVDPINPGSDLMDPVPIPEPPKWTRGQASKSFGQGKVSGDPMPLIDATPAPILDDPRYPVAREYVPPASNLPMTVSAAQSKRHNCDRGNTPWDSETEAAPTLAGTRSGTPSATPVAEE